MSKLKKILIQLYTKLTIIERYNQYYMMGAEEDIKHLKDKLNNFKNLPKEKIEKELKYCINIIELYYKDIDIVFIEQYKRYIENNNKEMYD